MNPPRIVRTKHTYSRIINRPINRPTERLFARLPLCVCALDAGRSLMRLPAATAVVYSSDNCFRRRVSPCPDVKEKHMLCYARRYYGRTAKERRAQPQGMAPSGSGFVLAALLSVGLLRLQDPFSFMKLQTCLAGGRVILYVLADVSNSENKRVTFLAHQTCGSCLRRTPTVVPSRTKRQHFVLRCPAFVPSPELQPHRCLTLTAPLPTILPRHLCACLTGKHLRCRTPAL